MPPGLSREVWVTFTVTWIVVARYIVGIQFMSIHELVDPLDGHHGLQRSQPIIN